MSESMYVQHLGGYGVPEDILESRIKSMKEWGFVCLRSKPEMNFSAGTFKHWEIWYLPGAWAAQGDLKGKTIDEIRIAISNRIHPGTIEIAREHWGLQIE